MKKIHCRLSDALWENNMSPEALAEMTDIPLDRVRLYCDDALDIVELPEVTIDVVKLLSHEPDILDIVFYEEIHHFLMFLS